jgi:hypothetical protein
MSKANSTESVQSELLLVAIPQYNGVVIDQDFKIQIHPGYYKGDIWMEPSFYSPQSPDYSQHSSVFREGGHRINRQQQTANLTEEKPTTAETEAHSAGSDEETEECYCICHAYADLSQCSRCTCESLGLESSYEDPDDTMLDASYEFELDMN